ncbi:DJ-1/PfpI family protein [Pseudocolwellia sp. AS88]|nr:DJ-1/PfpI family protein [Pseudocolwellia sp. AS88]MDO7083323.1 DJ-1/PfpI family protein [Pseudocolwellia sp. AS88]
MNIGIYIYNNAEVLDFSGPFEVFTTAERISEKPVFNTFLINQNDRIVKARSNFKLIPDYQINNHPKIDLLIIVGGDHTNELNKKQVTDWILDQSTKVQIVASVCTGVFLLAKAGVIYDHEVTTHWEDINDLQIQYPKLRVKQDVRWVEQGKIITSGGISAGIDMSLHLVKLMSSHQHAIATAKQMEFCWSGL